MKRNWASPVLRSSQGQGGNQHALRRQAYGDWEFEVKDPNGYELVFSELTE
jgi:hypothetical protein